MWLRYGVCVLLVSSASCATSSDDEISKWVLSKANKTEVKEPVEEKLDLTPTDIQTTIDCLLDDGRQGQCVQYYQCDGNKNIIEDGTTLIDFRRARKCLSYLEICCGFQQISNPDVNSEPVEQTNNTTTEPPVNDKKAFANIPIDEQCGWNNVQTYIFPNKTKDRQIYANYGEYRWMIALIKKRKNVTVWVSDDYIGGGSLIHPSVVITAAHKVHNFGGSELKCRGGEWDVQTENEQYKFQERDANKIVIHPDYYRTSLYYDAALVFLKKPFDLEIAPHMGLACLNPEMPPPNQDCFTMGWGRDMKNKYAVLLKKNKLSLVSPKVCETKLQATRLGPFFRLHPSLTCAGGEDGIDACEKDGGSSLVCPIQESGDYVRYAVVGMVAYGIGCGEKNHPGVYVNIPVVHSWVDKVMTDEKYSTVTYTI